MLSKAPDMQHVVSCQILDWDGCFNCEWRIEPCAFFFFSPVYIKPVLLDSASKYQGSELQLQLYLTIGFLQGMHLLEHSESPNGDICSAQATWKIGVYEQL